ncbi:PREDICTED: rab GTPase-activating protein 1-like [Acropora digitifera]|uniref:rab GTPase-activating protein 1-like n=1 Tax=Acropora digitifera TaxID=70779 RepID=UPI00077AD5C4|nr:PREDICTED: rab GTPase-activating protein 1-like [Acropora digitifera]
MADESPKLAEYLPKADSSARQPSSPRSKSVNGDHEFIVLAVHDIESDSGSAVSMSSMDKSKSQGSSVSSFADVIIPDMEATLEKGPTEEELKNLVEDAKRDFSHHSSTFEGLNSSGKDTSEVNSDDTEENVKIDSQESSGSPAKTSPVLSEDQLSSEASVRPVKQHSLSAGEAETSQETNEESVRNSSGTCVVPSDDESDENAVLFDGVTYLGSSTVNAPVSEIELKRTMSILREQTNVTIDVLLYVGSTADGMIRLMDPSTHADIATYRIQRILFCGRGDAEGSENDCFAFNTVHGHSEIFHCHVFRCEDPEKTGKILRSFSQSFRGHRKRKQQPPQLSEATSIVAGISNRVFKFDVTLDILEEDSKGFCSVARDKNCFKLRQNLFKKVSITVQQLTNQHLIVERCFGLLICPGKNVRYSDMHLLSEIVFITDTRLFVTIAVDLVVKGVTEPVRFIVETKAKIFPSGEKFFWTPSKPKFREIYILELKEVFDSTINEKGFEVKTLKTESSFEAALNSNKRQTLRNRQLSNGDKSPSDDDDEDDEPLLSGSGAVHKECSEEELGSWADLLSKWKGVTPRPKQLPGLVRKGIPEPLRGQVWQMMAGVKENDELLECYKHLLKKVDPLLSNHGVSLSLTLGEETKRDRENEVSMTVGDGGKTYFISGQWDPTIRDLLVLNTETPKAQVFDSTINEKGFEVKTLKTESSFEAALNSNKRQTLRNRQLSNGDKSPSDDDDEDDEPLLSGSGAVHKECSEEELGSWADLLSKWKGVTPRPKQLPGLVRKGIPEPLRGQVWQMMAGVKENDELLECYKHLLKKESPTEQVIVWDIHRTFPAHEYFKSSGGEGQEMLYKISKVSLAVTNKKMKKYEKEYVLYKEQEAQLEDPIERLQRENKRLFEANMRLEYENDNLAHELVTSKVELHSKLSETEEKVEELSKSLENTTKSLMEAEDQREKFKQEGSQIKEMWRGNIEQAEEERKRHTAIIEEYKKICSQMDERTEKLKEDLHQELLEVKRRVKSCENCAALFSDEGHVSLEGDGSVSFKTSVKVVDTEQRLRELELELAQTKLSLVETECRSQELEHRLTAIMAAAEENKPWFKRISLVKDSAK